MQKILGRVPVLAATLILAAAGFFLRLRHLNVGFDPQGLPNGRGVWPLVILCVLSLAAFLLVSLKKEKRCGYEENFSPDMLSVLLSVLAAGLLLAGNVMAFTRVSPMATPVNQMLTRVTAALGAASGLSFVGIAAAQHKGEKPSAALHLLPVVYYILQMIFNFKSWSTDPIILDYCFKLFALIFVMLAVFHAGGFVFGTGQRRSTVFLCLAGVFFSIISPADGGASYVLITSSSALWLTANGWQIMKD